MSRKLRSVGLCSLTTAYNKRECKSYLYQYHKYSPWNFFISLIKNSLTTYYTKHFYRHERCIWIGPKYVSSCRALCQGGGSLDLCSILFPSSGTHTVLLGCIRQSTSSRLREVTLPIWTPGSTSVLCGCQSSGTGCPDMLWSLLLEDLHKLPGQPAWVVPALCGGLDHMSSRGPFQFQPFCGSGIFK